MKYEITRSERPDGEPPVEGAEIVERREAEYVDHGWMVEVESLEELHELIDEVEDDVIVSLTPTVAVDGVEYDGSITVHDHRLY